MGRSFVIRHSSASWNPGCYATAHSAANLRCAWVTTWVPACAGTTRRVLRALQHGHAFTNRCFPVNNR
ncbi:MAG: hypothetical protein FJY56_13620 [Betaproteobacteria bacterium]|nr:hypothetical protein [Betaproteobacteria bacterium]